MKGKIFNAQEVQAILNGSKVMFREVIKPQPWHVVVDADFKKGNNIPKHGHDEKEIKCPYQVGQEIFCKESFSYSNQTWCDNTIFYKASHGDIIQHTFSFSERENKWRSPMAMREYDSRLTLLIKEIRVEGLAEISEEDCWKEGLQNKDFTLEEFDKLTPFKIINRFARNWNATHKKPEEKFEANPWVWCVNFEVINN